MFKVYVIHQAGKKSSEVLPESRTTTPSADAALAGWRHLYDQPMSGDHVMVLTRDGVRLASHRFGALPGDPEHAPRDFQIPE